MAIKPFSVGNNSFQASQARSQLFRAVPPPGLPFLDYNTETLIPGNISAWANEGSDATGNLVTGGTSNPPECVYVNNGPVGKYVSFVGASSEALTCSTTGSAASHVGAIFAIVMRWTTANSAIEKVFDGNDSGNRNSLYRRAVADDYSWAMYAGGTGQYSGAAAETNKWVRIVGRFSDTTGKVIINRVTHCTGGAIGTQGLDGLMLGAKYDQTEYGSFDVARLTFWNDGTTLLEAEQWLEANWDFEAVPPGNPVHWYDPNDYGPNVDQGDPGLVAYWSFDDANTSGSTLTDVLGTGLNATLVASPTTGVVGQRNEAYTFNGTTQYLDVGNQAALDFDVTDTFSVSCWFKMPTGGNYATLVSKYRYNTASGWQTFVNPDGSLGFSLSNAPFSAARYVYTQTLTHRDDTWRHAVFTYDGSNTVAGLKIYVNGVSVAVTTGADGDPIATLNSNSVFIGARDDASPSSFVDGEMDETAVFNIELSAADVSNLYGKLGYPATAIIIAPSTLVDKGTGGENLVCTDMIVELDSTVGGASEQKVFSFNGTTSKAIDDGAFSLTGDQHLVALCARPTTENVGRALFGKSENGTNYWYGASYNASNVVQRGAGTNQNGSDLDTLAPFNTSLRWTNHQSYFASAGGNGGSYVDGTLSASANEGDLDPDSFSIGTIYNSGGTAYISYFAGNMSDIIVHTGASEANAVRAAQVEEWLKKNRRLATVPGVPVTDIDAETLSLTDGDPVATWTNPGTDGNFTSANNPVFKATGGPDRTAKKRVNFNGTNHYMDSGTYTVRAQPGAGFAVFRPETQPGSGVRGALLHSSQSTYWGLLLDDTLKMTCNAGSPEIETSGTTIPLNEWSWAACEWSGATGHVGASTGTSTDATVGTGTMGPETRIGKNSSSGNYFDGDMSRIMVWTDGTTWEMIEEYARRRYPGIKPY